MSRQWYGCQCLRFGTCTEMLMHAIARGGGGGGGGGTNTVSESALNVDYGRKIPCRTGDSNLRQYCAWVLSRTLYHLSYPALWPLSSADEFLADLNPRRAATLLSQSCPDVCFTNYVPTPAAPHPAVALDSEKEKKRKRKKQRKKKKEKKKALFTLKFCPWL